MLIDHRLDELRAQLPGPRWRRLVEQCDWYRTQTPPTEHPSASITYFGPAAANLALAYRLTGHEHYRTEAKRWISAAIGFPHWGKAQLPDHDLDAGWLLHGLSLAYTWLGADFELAAELRAKLELQGSRLYEFAVETEGQWWSSSYWQNHNWICYTGLAAAGYALGRTEWTERAKANFATVIDLLPADGSDMEGVVYWRYGVPWLATYLDLLQDREGLDWWDRCRFLANTFSYRLQQCAPGFEENIDHGDCHDRRSGHSVALYYKLASAYRIGAAQWLAEQVAERFFWREAYASGVKPGVMPEAYLEFLWYDATVPAVDPAESAPLSAYFPDLGLVTARTGWDDEATMVSFKASPGGGHQAWETSHRLNAERGWDTLSAGHHHPDSGSFVLTSRGAFLAVDEGYSNRKRAGDHNLILVDGQGFADEDRYHVYKGAAYERQAQLVDVLAADGIAHATARIAAMYPAELGIERLDRTLVFTPAGRLVLLDRCVAAAPREWTFLLHADWPLEFDGDDVVLRAGSAQAWVRTHSPVTVSSTVTEVEANPTSSTPSLRLTRTMHTLRATTERRPAATLLTTIEPTSSLRPDKASARRIELTRGVGIAFDNETVLLAENDGVVEGDGVPGGASVRAKAVIVSAAGTTYVGRESGSS
ncbi:heparinase II/III family protein [Kribbella sp. NPDC048915]|uniref:heparinase II/III family protein n=1 Tax=Kribbella sp. NPDC048915 TaxID=3155148 RepID=UPI0033FB34B5